MFTPHTLGLAIAMMIVTAFCWGSWANTYKGVKGYRFELFYWDYAVGIFLAALLYAFTIGSSGHNISSFTFNVHLADARAALCCTKVGARAIAKHDEAVEFIRKSSRHGNTPTTVAG